MNESSLRKKDSKDKFGQMNRSHGFRNKLKVVKSNRYSYYKSSRSVKFCARSFRHQTTDDKNSSKLRNRNKFRIRGFVPCGRRAAVTGPLNKRRNINALKFRSHRPSPLQCPGAPHNTTSFLINYHMKNSTSSFSQMGSVATSHKEGVRFFGNHTSSNSDSLSDYFLGMEEEDTGDESWSFCNRYEVDSV